MIERQVYLSEEDLNAVKEIHSLGKNIFLQAVPTEKVLNYDEILKEYNK